MLPVGIAKSSADLLVAQRRFGMQQQQQFALLACSGFNSRQTIPNRPVTFRPKLLRWRTSGAKRSTRLSHAC
jgi:hypothetical protein